jgi:hypothetical protein
MNNKFRETLVPVFLFCIAILIFLVSHSESDKVLKSYIHSTSLPTLIDQSTSTPALPLPRSLFTPSSQNFILLRKKVVLQGYDIVSATEAVNVLGKIARCESGNDPLAKNKSSSAKGLLQILDGTWESFQCTGDVLDPEDNMRCGVKIAMLSGLHHWDESRKCWGKLISKEELAAH